MRKKQVENKNKKRPHPLSNTFLAKGLGRRTGQKLGKGFKSAW
jgi:hypothetical protein